MNLRKVALVLDFCLAALAQCFVTPAQQNFLKLPLIPVLIMALLSAAVPACGAAPWACCTL